MNLDSLIKYLIFILIFVIISDIYYLQKFRILIYFILFMLIPVILSVDSVEQRIKINFIQEIVYGNWPDKTNKR